jgi:uncharacterized protein
MNLFTDGEQKFIDDMLMKYSDEDDGIYGMSDLDGFITAIVSGPDAIMPSEWLPRIFSLKDEMPVWKNEKQFQRFVTLVIKLMNNTVDALINAPEEFEACFLVNGNNTEHSEQVIVDEWCFGYMRGVQMRKELWSNAPNHIKEKLSIISLFGSDDGLDMSLKMPEEALVKLKKKIEPALRDIHAYWLSYRSASVDKHHPPASAQILPFVRSQPKISPNAPCPCGSGKKYKKCCGLH